jgi:hypothetical protein
MRNTLPGATGQSIGAFQTGDTRLNTRAKISEFTVDPRTLDHGVDGKPALLVKGDIVNAPLFGRLYIGAAGVAAVSSRLPGRITL